MNVISGEIQYFLVWIEMDKPPLKIEANSFTMNDRGLLSFYERSSDGRGSNKFISAFPPNKWSFVEAIRK